MKAIIAAMSKNRVIGKDGGLPWHLPEDMKNFKRLTMGHTVIMGRKTYESIPEKYRPLPGRKNIVLSRSMEEEEGIDVCRGVDEAFEKAEEYEGDVFVIGGESIYRQTLDRVDKMFISHVDMVVDGDTYFPEVDEENWEVEEKEEFDEFKLLTYRRKK